MTELVRKNFNAMSEGLKTQRSQISELQKTIKQYNNLMGQLQQQVQNLQGEVAILKAGSKGTGSYAS